MKASHPLLPKRALALCLLFLLPACSDSPGGPGGEGEMVVRLVSPSAAEGAALLEVSAAEVLEVSAPAGVTVFAHPLGERLRIGVLRDDPGELRFQALVRDVRDPPAIAVIEVAGPDNALRPSVAEYEVRLTRVGQ
jgi:hypothetical protein